MPLSRRTGTKRMSFAPKLAEAAEYKGEDDSQTLHEANTAVRWSGA